jgi:hypothetical protein
MVVAKIAERSVYSVPPILLPKFDNDRQMTVPLRRGEIGLKVGHELLRNNREASGENSCVPGM